MTPEQLLELSKAAAELPLHGILLIIVIVLWLDLRKTRQALDDCLSRSAMNSARLDYHEATINSLIEDVMK